MADFGVNELNILASSGTPQIESIEQLNIRTGHSATGIGSTVVMGSKDSDFSSPSPSHVDTGNNVVLNVGVVTCNKVFGKLNGLTYPHQNGVDGYVLTSDGGGNVGWEVNPGGGSGAGTVDVSAVTGSDLTDNTYHLTFVSGTSNAQAVRVSTGATIKNNTIFAEMFTARKNATAEDLMNESSLHRDGGLELRRNKHNVTAGGPYIDFTKNIVNYPDFTSNAVHAGNNYIQAPTNIMQREWTVVAGDVNTSTNIIGGGSDTDAHSLGTGDPVRYTKSSGNSIEGITQGITYYAGYVDNYKFKLYPTKVDADNDTNVISITNAGSGTHTFKLGTLNTGDVLIYKGAVNTTPATNINSLTVDTGWAYVVSKYSGSPVQSNLNRFQIATNLTDALNGVPLDITQGTAQQKFEVTGTDFDARIQLDSLNSDDASILFRTPIPGTSLPSGTGKSQVRMEVTREGAVVSGIMTVAHSSDLLDGTSNYIQTGIGTNFKDDQYVLTRDDKSKMVVFDPSISATKKFVLNANVFGYGDSLTIYNSGGNNRLIVNDIETGANVRIWLAGTNVQAAQGYNDAKIHLSPNAMATLTYVWRETSVDNFVITGGGVYV